MKNLLGYKIPKRKAYWDVKQSTEILLEVPSQGLWLSPGLAPVAGLKG